jgi:hypothetical protein
VGEVREIVEVSSGIQPFVIRIDNFSARSRAKSDVVPRQVAKFELTWKALSGASLVEWLPRESGLGVNPWQQFKVHKTA